VLAYTYHSQILKRPSSLNILQRRIQILQLGIDLALRLLRALHSLRLERLNRLDLAADIVLLRLEAIDLLLDVGDDVLVFEDAAVLREVDALGLVGEDLDPALRVVVALLEVGEGVGRAASETQFGSEVGPVDLHGGGALLLGVSWFSSSPSSNTDQVAE